MMTLFQIGFLIFVVSFLGMLYFLVNHRKQRFSTAMAVMVLADAGFAASGTISLIYLVDHIFFNLFGDLDPITLSLVLTLGSIVSVSFVYEKLKNSKSKKIKFSLKG